MTDKEIAIIGDLQKSIRDLALVVAGLIERTKNTEENLISRDEFVTALEERIRVLEAGS